MNELPSEPAPEVVPDSVFQIWTRALTKPSEHTYAALASSPRAKATTAYLWMFVASLIQFLLSSLVQRQMIENFRLYGFDVSGLGPRTGVSAILCQPDLCGANPGCLEYTDVCRRSSHHAVAGPHVRRYRDK